MYKSNSNFEVGMSICTLGSICILAASFLLISPVIEYVYPSWTTEVNGNIQINFLPLPNFFMLSGFLMILSGVIYIYQYKLLPKNKKISYVAEFIFMASLFLLLVTTICTIFVLATNSFVITTPQQFFGSIFQ